MAAAIVGHEWAKARKNNDNPDELFDLGKLNITADRCSY